MLIAMVAKVAGLDARVIARSLTQLDVDEQGGAPLLGVRGVSIISHGKSSPRAMENAIMVAFRAYESGMTDEIGRRLSESMPSTSGNAA